MSEITAIQKQMQDTEENNLQTRQDNLQDEVLVDTLALEDEAVMSGERVNKERSNKPIDHLDNTRTSQPEVENIPQVLDASLFEDVEVDQVPPMIRAMRLLGRLLDMDLAQRALELGDDGALTELRTGLLQMVEGGLNPAQIQLFQDLTVALDAGKARLESGEIDSELLPDDVEAIKSVVQSGLLAMDAVHSEIWNEDDETILAFQNLSQTEAAEVQDDLSTLDEDTVSPADRQKIKAEGITALEVEEVLVDFWEAAQNEEYEIVEDEDVD